MYPKGKWLIVWITEIMNCNPICVGIAMSIATGGRMMWMSEMAKPAIIRGTMSQDTRAVLSGLMREMLLKYQMETGAVIKNTTHDSRKISMSGFIFVPKQGEMIPQTIMPRVAKTESWKETEVIHAGCTIATKKIVRNRFHPISEGLPARTQTTAQKNIQTALINGAWGPTRETNAPRKMSCKMIPTFLFKEKKSFSENCVSRVTFAPESTTR